MCDFAERGIQLTGEQLAEYNASKRGRRGDVSFLRVPPPEEIADAAPFTLRSLGGAVMKAMGLTLPKKEKGESTKAAERKRRGRLFEHIDLEKSLGSMQEIDEQLKPK
jgi:hypothetical protein